MNIDIIFFDYHVSNSFVTICVNYSSSSSLGLLIVELGLPALGLQFPARPAAAPLDPERWTTHHEADLCLLVVGLLVFIWAALHLEPLPGFDLGLQLFVGLQLPAHRAAAPCSSTCCSPGSCTLGLLVMRLLFPM